MGEDRADVKVFTDRLSYWQFIQDVEYDIRVTSNKETKNKEIYNKNEMIAMFKIKVYENRTDRSEMPYNDKVIW